MEKSYIFHLSRCPAVDSVAVSATGSLKPRKSGSGSETAPPSAASRRLARPRARGLPRPTSAPARRDAIHVLSAKIVRRVIFGT